MAPPATQRFPRYPRLIPFAQLWTESKLALTGEVTAFVIALITIWDLSERWFHFALPMRVAVVALFLSSVTIWLLFRLYSKAVSAIYADDPATDRGISVVAAHAGFNKNRQHDSLGVLVQIDQTKKKPRKGAAVLFTCVDDVEDVSCTLDLKPMKPPKFLRRNMFEVYPDGKSGTLWLSIDSHGSRARIANIEWSDPHVAGFSNS